MKTTLRDGEFAVTRSRPAFEKLAIGPAMVFGEAIAGGHYMDVLRFRKQMFVGRHGAPSYWSLHKLSVSETGYVGAFYRGFLPWGLLQCVKGIPLLFIQTSRCISYKNERDGPRTMLRKHLGS